MSRATAGPAACALPAARRRACRAWITTGLPRPGGRRPSR
jgi:hypothetical protein